MFGTPTQSLEQLETVSDENRRLREENKQLRAQQQAAEAEIAILLQRLTELAELLAAAKDADRQISLALELKVLNERLAQQNRTLFGSSSERRGPPTSEPASKPTTKARKPRK